MPDQPTKPKRPPTPKKTKTLIISVEAHDLLAQKARQSHALLHGPGAYADTFILNKLREF